jgi:hypothetical protein
VGRGVHAKYLVGLIWYCIFLWETSLLFYVGAFFPFGGERYQSHKIVWNGVLKDGKKQGGWQPRLLLNQYMWSERKTNTQKIIFVPFLLYSSRLFLLVFVANHETQLGVELFVNAVQRKTRCIPRKPE